MKKLISLFVVIVLLTSCSSSDDSTTNSNNAFNPPSWIQGTWLDADSSTLGFKFTSDDFCSVIGNQTNCFKSSIENSQGANTVDEEISSTEYKITLRLANNAQTNTFLFKNISSTQIQIIQSSGVNPIYVKQ